MKILIFIVVGIVLIYVFTGDHNSSSFIGNNYGQYDKGTPECDKGAYGDINGLCKWIYQTPLIHIQILFQNEILVFCIKWQLKQSISF